MHRIAAPSAGRASERPSLGSFRRKARAGPGVVPSIQAALPRADQVRFEFIVSPVQDLGSDEFSGRLASFRRTSGRGDWLCFCAAGRGQNWLCFCAAAGGTGGFLGATGRTRPVFRPPEPKHGSGTTRGTRRRRSRATRAAPPKAMPRPIGGHPQARVSRRQAPAIARSGSEKSRGTRRRAIPARAGRARRGARGIGRLESTLLSSGPTRWLGFAPMPPLPRSPPHPRHIPRERVGLAASSSWPASSALSLGPGLHASRPRAFSIVRHAPEPRHGIQVSSLLFRQEVGPCL